MAQSSPSQPQRELGAKALKLRKVFECILIDLSPVHQIHLEYSMVLTIGMTHNVVILLLANNNNALLFMHCHSAIPGTALEISP